MAADIAVPGLPEELEEGEVQIFRFHVGDQQFGADVVEVRQVLSVSPPVPPALQVGGGLCVLLDLADHFRIPSPAVGRRKVLVCRSPADDQLLGVVVDGIGGVVNVDPAQVVPFPPFLAVLNASPVAVGFLHHPDGLVLLLELGNLLSGVTVSLTEGVPDPGA